ncbi:hypothetical protein [Methylobacterium sp. E-045]|uniref:hypothetical protein n=1 Tax=Methylobacterium sp. E-045 TaxID=2836575 RepID=UPI001FBBFCA9|nr:hypothetical protein [Methylobacterium sp. E-045]MCJ2131391.1 hypothetical protein [Methylobacterium sp. E-045]
MDTSFLAGGPITWAALIAFALFLVAVLKVVDWIASKLKTREKEAVSPLVLDLASVKLNVERQGDALNAFKVEVAQKYVTGDVITRLEGRIDGMVSSVRDEMRATRTELLDAVLNGRSK